MVRVSSEKPITVERGIDPPCDWEIPAGVSGTAYLTQIALLGNRIYDAWTAGSVRAKGSADMSSAPNRDGMKEELNERIEVAE
jgi:hypothetical protein